MSKPVIIKSFPGQLVDHYLKTYGVLPSEQDRAVARVKQDLCAKCDGELDTGWECNKCGWDGQPFALMTGIKREKLQ
jgi:hypothetical protein